MSMVTALFRTRHDAERAYEAAVSQGCDPADINVMMSDDTRARFFSPKTEVPDPGLDAKAAEDTSGQTSAPDLGGPAGGTMGTLAPVLAAAGVFLLLPGLGIIAAGPVAIALTAAGSVGLAGGIIGALTHWGIPADRTEKYEAGVRDGGILLGVKTRSTAETAAIEQEWAECGATFIDT